MMTETKEIVLRLTNRNADKDLMIVQTTLSGYSRRVYLRVFSDDPFFYNLDYSLNSEADWIQLKHKVDATTLSRQVTSGFTGSFTGIYATSNLHHSDNFADFDWFQYQPHALILKSQR